MRVLLVSVVLAVAGCDAAAVDGVTFSTDLGAYAPEATARVQLANGMDDPLRYRDLQCVSLQVRAEGGWAEARAAPPCKHALYELEAGAARVEEVEIGDAPDGTYRFQTVVVVDGIQEALATAPFNVDAALVGSP